MNALETGLYNILANNAPLTTALGSAAIYNQHAPQGTARPYVIFNHAGGGHENRTPSDTQNHIYLVKVVADGLKQAGTIDDLVTTALHQATLTVAGYTNFYTARETEAAFTETPADGAPIYHRGAYYRIRIDD